MQSLICLFFFPMCLNQVWVAGWDIKQGSGDVYSVGSLNNVTTAKRVLIKVKKIKINK